MRARQLPFLNLALNGGSYASVEFDIGLLLVSQQPKSEDKRHLHTRASVLLFDSRNDTKRP